MDISSLADSDLALGLESYDGPALVSRAITAGGPVCIRRTWPSRYAIRLNAASLLRRWWLGVRVTTVQPFPQVVNGVVGLVRMAGEHLDHFLARCTPYVIPLACCGRSPTQEANVPPGPDEGKVPVRAVKDAKLAAHLPVAGPEAP